MKTKPFVLITGSAVRVGREIAIDMASRGYIVGIHYNQSKIEALAVCQAIEKAGGQAKLFQADLTNEQSVNNLVKEITEQKLRLKVLINSAAIMPNEKIDQTSVTTWDEVFNLNLRAVWLLSIGFKDLLRDNHGVIINFADSGINKVWLNFPVYLITKTALVKLSQILAKEFAPKIRVVVISPGLLLKSDFMTQGDWDNLVIKTPLKQEVKMSDLLNAIDFCITNQSITGEVITLDGGYQLVS